jgi:hypothetical protein
MARHSIFALIAPMAASWTTLHMLQAPLFALHRSRPPIRTFG